MLRLFSRVTVDFIPAKIALRVVVLWSNPPLYENERERAMRTKLWTLVLAAAVLGFVMGGIAVSLRPASTSAVASSVATTHLQFLVKFIGQDPFLDLGTPGPSQ